MEAAEVCFLHFVYTAMACPCRVRFPFRKVVERFSNTRMEPFLMGMQPVLEADRGQDVSVSRMIFWIVTSAIGRSFRM